jgi:EmrB/QacA subfamily drug resistance transporter
MTPEAIHGRRWWILAVLCLSLLLIVAGNSSLNVTLPDIQTALGSSPSALQWIVDVYSLVFAGLLLPCGALADRFGRKTALQLGLILFALAALYGTFATVTWQLIVSRVVMGLGAAFIMPGTLSILTNCFPEPEERRKAISIWAGCAGLGGALGTVVSGLLLEKFWWGSTFFVNVPICVVALAAGLFLLPNSSDPNEAKLDPPGALLAIAGLTLLLYGVIEAPEHGWMRPTTFAGILGGLVVLGGFVAWELRSDHPMLDVRLFKVRSFTLGSTTITLQYFAMYGLYFALAQYLQLGHGYSPLATAFAGLPIGIFAMIGAPVSAGMVGRYGPRRVVGSGLLVSAVGLFLLGWVTATTSIVIILIGFCLVGLGNGQTTAPSTTLIMGSVPRAKSGVGSAVNDLSRELGGALGIAVLGSVMASFYKGNIVHRLTGAGVAPGIVASARSSVVATFDAAKAHPALAQTLQHQGAQAFSHAFGFAMLGGCVVILINSALVWSFQHRDRGLHPTSTRPLAHGILADASPSTTEPLTQTEEAPWPSTTTPSTVSMEAPPTSASTEADLP